MLAIVAPTNRRRDIVSTISPSLVTIASILRRLARASTRMREDRVVEIGDVFGATDWLEIGQDRVDQFADATGDHQWIHVDPERAKRRARSAARSRTAT